MELLSLNCASCGASLEDFQDKNEVKCDFCNNITKVLRPVGVTLGHSLGNNIDVEKFNNLISIMDKSMIAGNYKEAYDYCNKGLEIDPSNSSLWENKAICSFWIRTDSEIIGTEAKEILTYLNAAKSANPNSVTYETTASSLASNLFFSVYYKYLLKAHDSSSDGKNMDSWSEESIKEIITYLKLMDLCFDISPSKIYLEKAIEELTGLNKVYWFVIKKGQIENIDNLRLIGFDALKTRTKYIQKLKKFDPTYVEPEFPKKSDWCFIATVAMGSYDHPKVMELRTFRDDWILTKTWGQGFVNWYYHYGEKVAKVIDKSIVLKKICYLLIVKPLVYLSRIIKK